MIHYTEQYLPGGQFNKYYSVMPPAINNSGASLIVIVNALGLKLEESTMEIVGITDDRFLLMGNGQVVNTMTVPVDHWLAEFKLGDRDLSDDDKDLVRSLINQQIEAEEKKLSEAQQK